MAEAINEHLYFLTSCDWQLYNQSWILSGLVQRMVLTWERREKVQISISIFEGIINSREIFDDHNYFHFFGGVRAFTMHEIKAWVIFEAYFTTMLQVVRNI